MPEINPVLLVHGFYDKKSVFTTMSKYLSNSGWLVHSFDLTPNNGTCGLETLAEQICHYIDKNFEPTQPIDLIGFSMGGVVSRYYLQRLGGVERVQRYVNISAPNQGTLTAHLLPSCGIAQMRPGSSFLKDLNRDAMEALEPINVTVIWTPLDMMIVPAASSILPTGKHLKLPVLFHAQMLSDPRVLSAVSSALTEPLKSSKRVINLQPPLNHLPQKSLLDDDKT